MQFERSTTTDGDDKDVQFEVRCTIILISDLKTLKGGGGMGYSIIALASKSRGPTLKPLHLRAVVEVE